MEQTTGRRRSQRLFLQVRVVIEGTLSNKSAVSEETHTTVVNAHGALIEMNAAFEQGQTVLLRNLRTNESVDCIVKLVTPAGPGKFNSALEFKVPKADFWRISFPPDDWSAKNQ